MYPWNIDAYEAQSADEVKLGLNSCFLPKRAMSCTSYLFGVSQAGVTGCGCAAIIPPGRFDGMFELNSIHVGGVSGGLAKGGVLTSD